MKERKNKMFIEKGDIIIFDDKHYLVCGDSCDKKNWEILKEQATLTLTSPPYNVGKNNYGNTEKGGARKYITKDQDKLSDEQYESLLSNVLSNSLDNSKYVFWNISHTSGNKISQIDFMYKWKEKFVDTMVWVKNTSLPAIEPNVLNSDFEYIYIYIPTY